MKEKVVLFFIGLLGKRLRDRCHRQLKAKGLIALCIFLLPLCSGCDTLKLWYVHAFDAIAGTEEVVTATPVHDATEAQEFIRQSPRWKGYAFPTSKEPTIKIESYDINGKMVFNCPEFPDSKLPERHSSNVITSDGNDTNDHLGSYMYHDSRWNKHYTGNTKKFIVVIGIPDEKKIVAYSEVLSIS